MKKGQVTLFIIIGIVIIAVIGLGVFFRGSIIQSSVKGGIAPGIVLPQEVEEFRQQVLECVDYTAINSLIYIGNQGGYATLPEDHLILEDEGLYIPYYYDKKLNNVPRIETFIQSLESTINEDLPFCIDPELFPNLQIESKAPKTTVISNEEGLEVSTIYEMIIKSGETSFTLDRPYIFTYNINLNHMRDSSNTIVEEIIKNPNELDLEKLLDLNLEIDIIPIEEDIDVYLITDPESELDEGYYEMLFAARL
jgi:hypothetical protein